jgi:L-ascorbate metabolism protein UlaG (beta-lactamase superfamily)
MDLTSGVSWFRGSSVRIRRGGIEVQVDPLGLTEGSVADYVLLTHPHYDNFSEEEIARVRGPHTVVVAPASMKKQLEDADHFLRPGDMLQLDGFDVLGVPAYNG